LRVPRLFLISAVSFFFEATFSATWVNLIWNYYFLLSRAGKFIARQRVL
jgi:hypothetical protein